jgi:23S rRNA (guanosine2251-2'-O)-methyltransferase
MENRRNSRVNRSTSDNRFFNPDDEANDDFRPRDFTRPDSERNVPDRDDRQVRTDDRGWDDEPRRQPPVGRSGSRGRGERDSRPPWEGVEKPKNYYKPQTDRRPEPGPDEMVYGIQSVIETLRSGQQIDKLYMEKGLSNADIQNLAFQNRVTIQRVPGEKLDRLTRKNHQGVVCLVAAVQYVKLSNVLADVHERGEVPFILLLDRITDVRNFGAIARTAECAGVQCIVIPGKGSAAINSDAMKTSSGALNHISVCREFNLVDTVEYLKKSGVQVLACTEKSHRDLYTLQNDMTGPLAIVMGSEDDGISPDVLKVVDGHVKIPLLGNVGSLNVSVATGVVLYEVVRQRSGNVQ